MTKRLALMLAFLAQMAGAQTPPTLPDMNAILDDHVLTGFDNLATQSAELAQQAEQDCAPQGAALRGSYLAAFDAWIGVSHLRFGPSEADNRAFALAFWPDPRGKTPRALGALIAAEDPAVNDAADFASVSIAARGFYALELLLYDESLSAAPAYRCALIRAVARDIAATGAAIRADWQDYAALMRPPAQNETYRNDEEALRQIFTALLTGLEFTAQARLGRPLGSFERPRPRRAEARRAGRSLAHVIGALGAMRPLGALLSDDPLLDRKFARALRLAEALDDPIFAGVSEPQSRLRIEIVQQAVLEIRRYLVDETGPRLGIAAGFNALDGD